MLNFLLGFIIGSGIVVIMGWVLVIMVIKDDDD